MSIHMTPLSPAPLFVSRFLSLHKAAHLSVIWLSLLLEIAVVIQLAVTFPALCIAPSLSFFIYLFFSLSLLLLSGTQAPCVFWTEWHANGVGVWEAFHPALRE